jgi:hypothetical protein
MYLVFELVMRYCDYETFVNCSVLDKRCSYICNKLVKELKKVEKSGCVYETFWNGKRQGLCYYYLDPHTEELEIEDYEDDKMIARCHRQWNEVYMKYNKKKYETYIDEKKERICFSIPGYSRTFYSMWKYSYLFNRNW